MVIQVCIIIHILVPNAKLDFEVGSGGDINPILIWAMNHIQIS